MSENQNVQVDINDLLESFARENANAVKRAVIAEAGIKARDQRIANMDEAITQLGAEVRRLRDAYEPDENSPKDGIIEPAEEIEVNLDELAEQAPEPTPIRRPRRTAGSKAKSTT